jgi:hypothetical protein
MRYNAAAPDMKIKPINKNIFFLFFLGWISLEVRSLLSLIS